jgi:hypothetical protein
LQFGLPAMIGLSFLVGFFLAIFVVPPVLQLVQFATQKGVELALQAAEAPVDLLVDAVDAGADATLNGV